jgi:hypothetical protein
VIGEPVEPFQVEFQRALHPLIVANGCPYGNPQGELNVSHEQSMVHRPKGHLH